MLSLNQIKSKLITWFENHALINNVFSENNFNFAAERNITYPVVNIEPLDPSVNDRTLNYVFKIILADLSNGDKLIESQVQNDMLLIAEDFQTMLQQTEGFVLNKVTQYRLFTDDKGDRTTGVLMTVTLQVIRSQNICAIPTII